MSLVTRVIALATAVGQRIKTVETSLAGKMAVGANMNASQIASGTIDPARLPALKANNTIVSTGDLTALTTQQQNDIEAGTTVLVADGAEYKYTGTGSKTLAASYYFVADRTPDWSVIQNKPTTSTAAGLTDLYTKTELGDPETDFVTVFNTAAA